MTAAVFLGLLGLLLTMVYAVLVDSTANTLRLALLHARNKSDFNFTSSLKRGIACRSVLAIRRTPLPLAPP